MPIHTQGCKSALYKVEYQKRKKERENDAVVQTASHHSVSLHQALSLGEAVCAHGPEPCNQDILYCLDCNKCQAVGVQTQSRGLADILLDLPLSHLAGTVPSHQG